MMHSDIWVKGTNAPARILGSPVCYTIILLHILLNILEEVVNVKWCVSKVPQYIKARHVNAIYLL